MRYRMLGDTGLRVSEIGLGGAVYAGTGHGPVNEVEAIAAIRSVLDSGINYIDTSRHYGPSEEIIGKALAGYQGECIITTKLQPNSEMSAAEAVSGVEESLEALQRDHVDILLAHDIQQAAEGDQAAEIILKPGGMVDGFRQLQREGRVRFIGVSGRLAEVAGAIRTGEFDVVLCFNRFNLLDWSAEDELLPLAHQKNVGVTMGGVFYQAFLSLPLELALERAAQGMYWPWDLTDQKRELILSRREKLYEFAERDLSTLRRLALQFVLAEPRIGVAVVGMKTPTEVQENLHAVDSGSMAAETIERLKLLS